MIDDLRTRILRIECHAPRRGLAKDEEGLRVSQRARWELGCPSFDALLPQGLEANFIHEVKGVASCRGGASAADWIAGIGFAARLAVRRLEAVKAAGAQARQPWGLWCWPRALASEFGMPSAAGLAHLGLDPARLLIVETARAAEALNAIEESLKAQCLAFVIGVLDEIELTPARRLSLAAGAMRTPALLVTHPASEPAGATATRWRVQRAQSGDHDFNPRAPGPTRFSIALERCRARPESTAWPPLLLEWCDETHRFGLASILADLPSQALSAASRAAASAVRSR